MNKLAALLLLATATAAVTPELRYFQYKRQLMSTTAPTQSCLVLDPAIYAHAAPNLADLRLYADGTETPYAIHQSATTFLSSESHKPLNLGKINGETAFDVAMPTSGYSDIELTINAQDFLANVLVSGSKTATSEGKAITAGKSTPDAASTSLGSFTIFDLTKQHLGRSTVLHLPASNFPTLHFLINGPVDPDAIAGLTIDHAPLEKINYSLIAESRQAHTAARTTTIELDVPAHTPVERIEFLIAPDTAASPLNFNRDVTVTAQEVAMKLSTGEQAQRQEERTSGSILRVHRNVSGQRIDEERLAIDAPWTSNFSRASHWTIEIANRDDAPIPVTAVRLLMQQRQLCFDALADKNYAIYYGDPALEAPQYDYAQLFTLSPTALAEQSGAEQANPIYQARPDSRPFTDRHPALLWIALILVVAILAVVALKSAKPSSDDNQS